MTDYIAVVLRVEPGDEKAAELLRANLGTVIQLLMRVEAGAVVTPDEEELLSALHALYGS